MKPERILLPINVANCPLEVFELVGGIARRPGVTVILLHVLELNILAPDNRVYEELARPAAGYLARLARACLPAHSDVRIHVRVGRPAEEIVAEARAEQVDLIILAAGRPSLWKQLLAPIIAPTVEKILRQAPCAVLVANAQTRFNCVVAWGRQAPEISAALDRLRHASGAIPPQLLPTADSATPRNEEHRLAA
jgi:nucleotide-binding universal stress UspA family protein